MRRTTIMQQPANVGSFLSKDVIAGAGRRLNTQIAVRATVGEWHNTEKNERPAWIEPFCFKQEPNALTTKFGHAQILTVTKQEKEKAIMSSPVLRAKLRISEVVQSKEQDGSTGYERVKLIAVYSNDPHSENAQWAKWTPVANFELTINNPSAFGTLSKGHEFYVDFTPAESA